NVDMTPVSTRVNWSGASRGLRTKGRTASIHCRPAPPRQTEALSSRTSRQPVLGSAVQDAQVPAGVPGPLRLDPGRAGPRPGLLRLVQHRTSPQRPRPAHAPRRALRLGRAARGRARRRARHGLCGPPRAVSRLELILSCRYRRVVARDNTVQLGGRWLQVPPGPGGASYAGRRLEVRELLDGRLVVMLDGRPLVTQPSPSPDFVLTPRTAPSADRRPHAASPDPRRLLRQAPAQPATPRAAPRTPPPPRHPWRQAFKRETRLSHPIKG